MINKKHIIILLLIILGVITLSSVSASDSSDIINASDDNVEIDSSIEDVEIDDDILGIEDSSVEDDVLESSKYGTFTELQKKIDNAKKGSTIYLTKDYQYNKAFGTKNGIRITKSLTIDGKGHSIDGQDVSALLLINKANNVVLKNMVFKGGGIDGVGSVCVYRSNNVKFDNCLFTDNFAKCGGAVYLEQGSSSFVGCSFNDNSADYGGGAIYSTHTSSSFVGCSFVYNGADYGGAIYSTYGSSSFVGCSFVENYVYYGGCDIYLDNCHDFSFDSCSFVGSFSDTEVDYGGAIYSIYSSSSFVGCNFTGNGNYEGDAGVIYLDYSSSSFVGCSFVDNVANYGGAIYSIYSSSSFVGCSFVDNVAHYGNAVSSICGDASFIDCNFDINGGYYDLDYYGTVYSFKSVLNILNCNFNNNSASSGGDICSQQSMIYLTNSSFLDSYSSHFGGSLSFKDDYVQIINSNFKSCFSNSPGGAIYCLDSIVDCFSSQFENCHADYGGAICSVNTDLLIQNNTFYRNDAGYYGGSIYCRFGSISVDSSIFSYSYASNGGAIYIGSPYRIWNITNNSFLYCSALNNGYRILVDGYNGLIPESGNIYEDVYFVYGDFTGVSCSNILTYIFSNSDGYQNDLSFYNNLNQNLISKIDYGSSDNLFYIFDEEYPNNSTIFLKYDNYTIAQIVYDLGHFYEEYPSPSFKIHILNLHGDSLDMIQCSGNDTSERFDDSLSYITYFSPYYSGFSLCPIADGEKNMTVFDEYRGTPYLWISSLTHDEYFNSKINGKLSFNFQDKELYYNGGDSYWYGFAYSSVPLFNPNYDALNQSLYKRYVTNFTNSIKNQDQGSNCWAFAGITTLEICLEKITGIEYDFSENNIKNLMGSSSIYGLNLNSNDGGYDSMLMSYLASWLGPIYESSDEYDPLSSLSIRHQELFHIQNIAFLSPRKNSSDNDEIKHAIMNYGAVTVTFNWTTGEYGGLHSISLVGWDDNYSGQDVLGKKSNGAWIFKNSWGEKWGVTLEGQDMPDIDDDAWWDWTGGYGYLSYSQAISGELAPYLHAYTFVFNDGDVGYQDIYQYDFAGFTDFLCVNNASVYYKNKFVAVNDEILLAFSTYFEKAAYFTFSVRINGNDINMTESNVPIEDSIHYSPAGYHTIPLGYNLTLNMGDEFEIIIRLVNGDVNYVPVCQIDELYKLSYSSNVSFISYNGEDWIDLYDLNSTSRFAYGGNKSNTCQVACIKAFTTSSKGDSLRGYFDFSGNHILSSYYDYYYLNEFIDEDGYYAHRYYSMINDDGLFLGIDNWDGYDQFENLIELNINDGEDTRYINLNYGGSGYLDIKQFWGTNKCSARLTSNFLHSNVIYFDFIYYGDEIYLPFSELEGIINNASDGSTIVLKSDYSFDIDNNSNGSYILINKSLTIDGQGHVLNGQYHSGIFKILPNCNVTFKNVKFTKGHSEDYGAIVSYGNLTIVNCEFSYNFANSCGGAIFADELSNLKIINSSFVYNGASEYGGSIFSRNVLNITDSNFKSYENREIVLYCPSDENGKYTQISFKQTSKEIVYFRLYRDDNNETYGNLYLKNNKMTPGTKDEVAVFYDDELPYNLPLHLVFTTQYIIKGENAKLCQIKDDDGNVFRIGCIDAKIINQNSPSRSIDVKINYDPALGGFVFGTSELDYGKYKLTGSLSEIYASNCKVDDGVLYIVKKSLLKSSGLTKIYGEKKKLTVTLKDDKGKAIKNVYLKVKLNGKTFKIKANSKGQASLAVNLAPKTYVATISFDGNSVYSSATKKVKVVIKNKLKAKLSGRIIYKPKTKKMHFIIYLKNNKGKPMKKAKITLTVKGKTYAAKTNSKGKVTFKVANLRKKGTYKFVVKYAGNKYYKKITETHKFALRKNLK